MTLGEEDDDEDALHRDCESNEAGERARGEREKCVGLMDDTAR